MAIFIKCTIPPPTHYLIGRDLFNHSQSDIAWYILLKNAIQLRINFILKYDQFISLLIADILIFISCAPLVLMLNTYIFVETAILQF